jgi:DNA-binding transcriptional LysR family regulator
MDWDKLRVFHAVAEAGSFTHAGNTLHLSQSAVSRQISALEENLRVHLFHRHARGLILTEQGELLYRTARDVFSKVAMTEAMLAESRERPTGPLTVSATVGFSTIWLTPRIVEFIDVYPEINVTLLALDHDVDLSMREADVAIRMRAPTQPDLIQRHLMTVHVHAYAAPAYLKEWGRPTCSEDLDRHRLIVYSEGPLTRITDPNWLLRNGDGPRSLRRPVLRVNNILAMLKSAQSGLGIAALPDYIMQDHQGLERVLPEMDGPTIEAYFVYPEELRRSKRIAVFRDFLLEKVKQTKF